MGKVYLLLLISLLALSATSLSRSIRAQSIPQVDNDAIVEKDSLPEYLQILYNAASLDAAAIGAAAVKTPTYQAFETALEAGSAIRPELEKMVEKATPAGRIYAAILLQNIDESAGRQAIARLQSDTDIVVYINGCTPEQMTVGEAATRILNGEMRLVIGH